MRSFTFINLGLVPQVRNVLVTLAASNCGSFDVERCGQLGDQFGAVASANGGIDLHWQNPALPAAALRGPREGIPCHDCEHVQ